MIGVIVIKQLSVQEAHQQQQTGGVYLDVRSIPEFQQAHPGGAYNIPICFISTNGPGRCGRTRSSWTSCRRAFRRRPRSSSAVRRRAVAAGMRDAGRLGITRTWRTSSADSADRRYGDEGWVTAGLPVETSAPDGTYSTLSEKASGSRQRVISRAFYTWERRLASAATNRAVRPFEWGLDWLVDDDVFARAPGRPVRPGDHVAIVGRADRGRQRALLRCHSRDRLYPCRRCLDVHERGGHAARQEQSRGGEIFSRSIRARPSTRGRGPAPVERQCRRARRPLPSAESIRHLGAPFEPSLSRRTDAPRAVTRRLHRQLEHRTNDAGLSSGRAGRAARDRVAARGGVQVDRHSRHEPRIVPGDADDGSRAADPLRRR